MREDDVIKLIDSKLQDNNYSKSILIRNGLMSISTNDFIILLPISQDIFNKQLKEAAKKYINE